MQNYDEILNAAVAAKNHEEYEKAAELFFSGFRIKT